ncbi:Hypothetical_protein [Hexamita inflata]|uniref:Hypothetical_protein n=1 Tax=Hexamita inflata TaxID=28002 RepID=A0AA86PHP1_9EUKA|nr:Hypothetical protein HINF_LOCUS23692 [Hexamita inflata]
MQISFQDHLKYLQTQDLLGKHRGNSKKQSDSLFKRFKQDNELQISEYDDQAKTEISVVEQQQMIQKQAEQQQLLQTLNTRLMNLQHENQIQQIDSEQKSLQLNGTLEQLAHFKSRADTAEALLIQSQEQLQQLREVMQQERVTKVQLVTQESSTKETQTVQSNDKVYILTQEINLLNKQNENLQELHKKELDMHRQKYQTLTNELYDTRSKLRNQENETHKARFELQKVTKSLTEDQIHHIRSLQIYQEIDYTNQLQEENQSLKTQIIDLKRLISDQVLQIQKYQVDLNDMQNIQLQSTKLQIQNTQLNNQIASLQQDYENMQQSYNETVQKNIIISQELSSKQSIIDIFNNKIEQNKDVSKDLKLQKQENEIKFLEANLNYIQTELHQQKLENFTRQREVDTLRRSIEINEENVLLISKLE